VATLNFLIFNVKIPITKIPTRTSRNQTGIIGVKNNRQAHRLSGYGFIGIGIAIGIEIDFLDSIAD